MKLVLLAIICILFSYIGFKLSNVYKKRVEYLKDFYSYLMHLEINICFTKSTLSNLTEKFKCKSKDLKDILISFLEYVNGDDKSQFELNLSKYLSKKDVSNFKDFFMQLGKIDYKSQVDVLKAQKLIIEKAILAAEKDNNTKGKLYFKLGLIIGIVIMILMV